MIDHVFSPAMSPFTISLGLVLVLSVAEVGGTLLGVSPAGLFDEVLPDIEADAAADVDGAADGWFSAMLGWLCLGRVPALVLLIAFLTTFGLIGFAVQAASKWIVGLYLPAVLAAFLAFALSLPPTRWLGLSLAHVMPKEETEAVSSRTFVGKLATITRGVARVGVPAEAKLRDVHGQMHYVLVEPDDDDAGFEQGTEVLLTSQVSAIRFRGIRNTNAFLSS